jgi:hypothetical protein
MQKIEIPADHYKPSAISCVGGLTSLGGIIAGIYHGIHDAKGIPIDPNLENALSYAPAVIGAYIGIGTTSKLLADPRIRAQMPQVPAEVEGCQKGCNGLTGIIGGGAITGAMTYVGYLIGGAIGKNI